MPNQRHLDACEWVSGEIKKYKSLVFLLTEGSCWVWKFCWKIIWFLPWIPI